ncbi:hypothetical protein LWI29_023049 [Acer saccharum]|uniref:Uncharacterized protein n=1 Tax=Acer saccharum TaxID=4024 RepID=A0AA39VTY7_ACESA|nr:hypothetical protein LWI29_023049 [Acer saccharum]
MPAYAKFFKELNLKARKKEFLERIVISKEASAAMETALPPKMKDPGSFIITISVGETRREKAMLDLGASINLMPYALFKDLGLEGLKPTTMELILANRSVRHPTGVVEDMLVRVGELIIPANFVILEMETDSTKAREMPILLGRPFMSTTKAIINVHKGRLSMTVEWGSSSCSALAKLKPTLPFNGFFMLSNTSNSVVWPKTVMESRPLWTSIIALAIDINGHLSNIDISLALDESLSISRITKSAGMISSPTLVRCHTERSANINSMVVGFNPSNPKSLNKAYGFRLIKAPRSNIAFSFRVLPTDMVMMKLPGSFILGGNAVSMAALASLEITILSRNSFFRAFELSSLKNLAYVGIVSMT